jgi:hypothetical protein
MEESYSFLSGGSRPDCWGWGVGVWELKEGRELMERVIFYVLMHKNNLICA